MRQKYKKFRVFISHRTDGAARAEDKFIWTMPSRDRGRRSQITEITEIRFILSCAKYFAQQGKHVVMPPKLNVTYKNSVYDTIFGTLRGTPYYGKCPDLIVDGVWYEHEGFTKPNPKSNFSNMLRRGLAQSDRIIIEKCGLSERIMRKSIRDRLASGIRIQEILMHDGEQITLVFKNTEGQ